MVNQIELDLGPDHDTSAPTMALPPKVHAGLARLIALAIIAVHEAARKEADDDDDRDRES